MTERRIEVRVVPFADRTALQLQWTDANTGLRKTRSARTNDPEEAERRRADLEYELNHGLHACGTRTSWERFRAAFEAEYLPGLRCGTRKIYATIFDHFERICQPSGMDGITARTISHLVVGLRESMQPATISTRLAKLKAAFRWAHKQGMLAAVPAFPTVKVPKRKPRPVPPDLYQRLSAATACPFLRAFVACGWMAGLRLGEAQLLSWEPSEAVPWLDFGRHRVWLPAAFVKGVEDQWVPLAQDLERMLGELPRHGPHVFPWHGLTRSGASCKVIALAKRAGVALTMKTLRAGFGCELAARVQPQTLRIIMRHQKIQTTLDYYANLDAAAEEAIRGNSSRNSSPSTPAEH